jgi:hypothetical protein
VLKLPSYFEKSMRNILKKYHFSTFYVFFLRRRTLPCQQFKVVKSDTKIKEDLTSFVKMWHSEPQVPNPELLELLDIMNADAQT